MLDEQLFSGVKMDRFNLIWTNKEGATSYKMLPPKRDEGEGEVSRVE